MQALVYPHDVASSVDGSVVYVVEISPNIILKMSSKRQVGWYPLKQVSVWSVKAVTPF